MAPARANQSMEVATSASFRRGLLTIREGFVLVFAELVASRPADATFAKSFVTVFARLLDVGPALVSSVAQLVTVAGRNVSIGLHDDADRF